MQATGTLNDLFEQYTQGELERKEFEGLFFKILLADIHSFNFNLLEEEERQDFIAWLYPRLAKAIDAYRNCGASFERYISKTIQLGAKEYRSRLADRKAAEYTTWLVRLPDMYACSSESEYSVWPDYTSEPEYGESRAITQEPIKRAKNPRQLLILILKCYYHVSDDFIERAAPHLGLEKEELKSLVDTIRKQRISRDEERSNMQERIYCQHYRCIIYEKRLRSMQENTDLYMKMKSRLERATRRLAKMRKRIAQIRPEATNTQIAKILGMPKGSVDSSLFFLKTRFDKKPWRINLN